MATTQVISATQELLRILVVSAASEGDAVDIPQATLVSDCAAGPLKEFFRSPLTGPPHGPDAEVWAQIHEDARLSVNVNSFGLTPSADNSYIFEVVSGVNVLHLSMGGTTGTRMIVELRFNHSIAR